MPVNDLRGLFEHELKDIYFAEHRLVEALDEVAGESTDKEIKRAFTDHKRETQQQIKRLERVFKLFGEAPEQETCQGIEGLLREKKSFNREKPSPEILDLYNLGAGMKNERYEITAYESLVSLASKLDMADAEKLLRENLDEEEAALAKLKSLSEGYDTQSLVNS